MTRPDDLAATQTLPGTTDTIDLMNRIQALHYVDPYEARRIYFTWKTLTQAARQHPEIWAAAAHPEQSNPAE